VLQRPIETTPTFGNWLGGGGGGKKAAQWYERDFSRNFCKFIGPVSLAGSPHCCRIKRLARTYVGGIDRGEQPNVEYNLRIDITSLLFAHERQYCYGQRRV
jgi:hypothetical protein